MKTRSYVTNTEWWAAIETNNVKEVKPLVNLLVEQKKKKGKTRRTIFIGKKKSNDTIIESLDQKNGTGYNALHLAATQGFTDIITLLINGGANIEATNNEGETAIMIAVSQRQPRAAKLLLNKGAKLTTVSIHSVTTMHAIAEVDDLETLEAAIVAGSAQFDVIDSKGRTPLHYAALNSHANITARLLTLSGVNTKTLDCDGKTAAQLATNETVLRMLSMSSKDIELESPSTLPTPVSPCMDNVFDLPANTTTRKKMEIRGFYYTLGVEKHADNSTIRKAYRKLAIKWHPDKNQGNKDAQAIFELINEAFKVLMDEPLRIAYDRYGKERVLAILEERGMGPQIKEKEDMKQAMNDLAYHFLIEPAKNTNLGHMVAGVEILSTKNVYSSTDNSTPGTPGTPESPQSDFSLDSIFSMLDSNPSVSQPKPRPHTWDSPKIGASPLSNGPISSSTRLTPSLATNRFSIQSNINSVSVRKVAVERDLLAEDVDKYFQDLSI